MNKKIETPFVYLLGLIFLAGSILILIRFYTYGVPNFYAFTIFLISILVLILFHDKLDEFSLSKEGFRFKIHRTVEEIQKPRRYEQEKEVFEKAYETEQEIKEGM